jgi:hypothetical protein
MVQCQQLNYYGAMLNSPALMRHDKDYMTYVKKMNFLTLSSILYNKSITLLSQSPRL